VARVAGAGLAAVAPPDADFLGLNKLPSENLPGDAEGAGVASTSVFAFLRPRFSAGEAEAAGSVVAGEAAAVVSAFLCARGFTGDGDAAGDSAVEGDAASSAGEAVAGAFLCARCFAGEGDAAGATLGASNCAWTRKMLARPITEMSARNFVVITASLEKRQNRGQPVSLTNKTARGRKLGRRKGGNSRRRRKDFIEATLIRLAAEHARLRISR